MKITVKDCLNLAAFDNADVVAASNHLDEIVKKVSVLEATEAKEVARYCGGKDQLLFTSFFGIRSDEDAQCMVIEALAETETAALAILHVGQVVKHLSNRVILTAERVGLPLIVMDPNLAMDLGDILSQVSGKLLMGDEQRENALVSNTVYHLLNFEKYSSFPEAAKEAALSNDFQLILLSEEFNPVLTVETRHRTTIAEAIKLGRQREMDKESSVYTMIDVDGVLTYWGPVTIQNAHFFMFIVDNEDSYSPAEITKLAEIIELAMGMWRYIPEQDSRTEMIKALRRGNMGLAYSMKEDAGVDPEQIVSVFLGVGLESASGEQLLAALESSPQLEVISLTEDHETAGIVMADDPVKGKNICIEIYNSLKKSKEDSSLFHVTGLDGLEGAIEAYRLIGEAWSFAGKVYPYKHVFTKYELTLVSNCIDIEMNGGRVKSNYLSLLDPFLGGRAKDKQLLETLTIFILDAGMNNSKTAAMMDIHTNTVQYRLKKINEMLGVEISGNRIISGLSIALALRRLEIVAV